MKIHPRLTALLVPLAIAACGIVDKKPLDETVCEGSVGISFALDPSAGPLHISDGVTVVPGVVIEGDSSRTSAHIVFDNAREATYIRQENVVRGGEPKITITGNNSFEIGRTPIITNTETMTTTFSAPDNSRFDLEDINDEVRFNTEAGLVSVNSDPEGARVAVSCRPGAERR